MSRRAIVVLAVFLVALVVINIVVLAIWLPGRKASGANSDQTKLTATASQNAPGPAVPSSAPAAGNQPVAAAPVPNSEDFAVDRQFLSASGNLRVKYLRDRKTKMRRIVVEDAKRPGASSILLESKLPGWALVSPDDQWIAVDERSSGAVGGVRLFHRNGESSVVPEDMTGDGKALQDAVWTVYLKATNGDPNTPRRGVTLDATAWENDSRKLDISVAYLPTSSNPDVPGPWSCTYDVASKQVEAVSKPSAGNGDESASAETDQSGQQSPGDNQQSSGAAAGNAFAENGASQGATEEGGGGGSEADSDNEYPGEKFPATRLDELTVADVNESSLDEITYAINEMFARHGADFKDKKIAKQFSQFSWYKPTPGLGYDDAEKDFSDLEKANLKVLGQCRDAKLASARRKTHQARENRGDGESTGDKILRGIRTWQDMGAPMPPHP